MKKKTYMRMIIAMFTVVYVAAMIIATVLEKKSEDYETYQFRDGKLGNIQNELLYYSRIMEEDEQNSDEYMCDHFLKIITDAEGWSNDVSRKYSVAVYKENGEKVIQTVNTLEIIVGSSYNFELDKYFNEEEQEFLKQVFWDREIDRAGISEGEERPPYWRIHAYVNEETRELAKVLFTTEYNWEVDEADYETPNTETKWSWINPDESVHENLIPLGEHIHVNYEIKFPYLRQGEKEYEKWAEHDYLQDFPETWTDYTWGVRENKSFKENQYEFVTSYYSIDGVDQYIIMYREVSEPWIQAITSLKYLYLCSAVFVVACMILVANSLKKYNEKREMLENTRRDFTNAIAHELKTPLGIIRGFAENSLENTNEAKREYYLKRIVGQTEEMDKLVKEMVYISKLDSAVMSLKKETVHLEDVVKSQLKKLETLSDEKNLDIKVNVDDDFTVQGDQAYLERAIWNVLHNAIEYNHLDGFIRITINKKELCIENSGVKLKEDEIAHVFDMFYTSDKSRNFAEKHMGLGLYLAKKILELHKMNITIGNTDAGVEVVIKM